MFLKHLTSGAQILSQTGASASAAIATRYFSTSQIASSRRAIRYVKAQERKKANKAKQNKLSSSLDQVDPVLGKSGTPFVERIRAEIQESSVLSHGYQKQEVDKLLYGAQQAVLAKSPSFNEEEVLRNEEKKREIVARVLNMRNASKLDQKKLAVELARQEFARFEGDTGSSEVQAAVMTMKIHYLTDHIKQNKKDLANIRRLRILVQQRQSILRYLKKDMPQKYFWAIEKLGLSDRAVTMEFNMDRRYMQDYKVFGDRILVRESKKVAGQKRREEQKQKRAERVAAKAAN